LDCSGNDLTELDTNNEVLEYLDCSDNELTELDVTQIGSLKDLDCSDNELTELDVSHNPDLETLDVRGNKIDDKADVIGIDPETGWDEEKFTFRDPAVPASSGGGKGTGSARVVGNESAVAAENVSNQMPGNQTPVNDTPVTGPENQTPSDSSNTPENGGRTCILLLIAVAAVIIIGVVVFVLKKQGKI
jgi:Leucine-rich repeat (LRR) protein